MPIYEYACEHCEHHFDTIQKISDEPLKQCPNCKNNTLQRLVSAASFRLKGGGWYETDFKESDKKKNLASSDNNAKTENLPKSDAVKSTETGTTLDTKPAKKDAKGDGSVSTTTSSSSNTSKTSGSSDPSS